MSKTLVIVESPNKIKKISEVLGSDYTVVASVGHITELAKGKHHGIGIDFKNNYKPKYVLSQDKVDVLKNILEKGKQCDDIIILSDPDREGEAIAWHLNERIKDLNKPIKRTTTDEITKPKILKAFKNLRDINIDMVKAQEARRVLDRIVGFMVSPYLIKSKNQNLSAGRVQSVAVRLIVDREEEINKFISETYYTIDANLNFNSIKFKASYPIKLKDKAKADSIFSIIEKSKFKVVDIEDSFEYKNPQPPLVTSTLQQTMSRIHGFGADQTMKSAQALYEAGLVTYIRTDSPAISKEALEEVRDYLKNNNHNIPKKANEYKAKDSAQEAHECIRPTTVDFDINSSLAQLSNDDKLVYDIIWKYFVASQCESAKYSTRKVILESDIDNKVKIKASGKALIEKNFLNILEVSDKSKIDIPDLQVGDIVSLDNALLETKKTQPPGRFSLDKLVSELDKRGIGRPSTYADILSKIESRNYVEKKGNVYHPTKLGIEVINLLKDNFKFMDYEFTSKMESMLDDIASGKLTYLQMISDFFPDFKKELDSAYLKSNIKLCNICKYPITSSNGKEYCSNYRFCRKDT